MTAENKTPKKNTQGRATELLASDTEKEPEDTNRPLTPPPTPPPQVTVRPQSPPATQQTPVRPQVPINPLPPQQTPAPQPLPLAAQLPPNVEKPSTSGSFSSSVHTSGATHYNPDKHKISVTGAAAASTGAKIPTGTEAPSEADEKNLKYAGPLNIGKWDSKLTEHKKWNFGLPGKLPGNVTAPYRSTDKLTSSEDGRKKPVQKFDAKETGRPGLASEIKLDFRPLKLKNMMKDTDDMLRMSGQNTEYRAALQLLCGTAWCLHQTMAKLHDLKERRAAELVRIFSFFIYDEIHIFFIKIRTISLSCKN